MEIQMQADAAVIPESPLTPITPSTPSNPPLSPHPRYPQVFGAVQCRAGQGREHGSSTDTRLRLTDKGTPEPLLDSCVV